MVDCAGFEDSRSPENDLVASFSNKLVLDAAKKLKFVIVENYSKFILTEDRTAFLKVLDHIAALLEKNHLAFRDSICLIATKTVDERADENVLESIKVCLEKTQKYLLESAPEKKLQIDILQFLQLNNKFAIFRKPAESKDQWWDIEKLANGWETMRTVIFENMIFAENTGTFNITLSKDSMIRLSDEENLKAEAKLYSLLETEITRCLILKFDKNTKDLGANFITFCDVYAARLARLTQESRNELIDFFNDQNLSREIVSEFQYCVRKVDFLMSATKRSPQNLAEVDRQILCLHGGLDKISDHFQEARTKFISDGMADLDNAIEQIAKTLRGILGERFKETKEPDVFDFLDNCKAKLASIITHEEVLAFTEEQGVKTTRVNKIKNILAPFQTGASCKNELNIMHGKIVCLNGELQKLSEFINDKKDAHISTLKLNVHGNIDKLVGSLMEKTVQKIESNNNVSSGIQLSDKILQSLKGVKNFIEFASFVREFGSESGEMLEQLMWQSEVLTKCREEKGELDYLMQKICELRQKIELSKKFITHLGDLQAQAENNYSTYRSHSEISSFLGTSTPDEFKEQVAILTKYGFSEKIVSFLAGHELNDTNVQRVKSILIKNLSLKDEHSCSIPTESLPVLRHYDSVLAVSENMKKPPHSSVHTVVLMASRRIVIDFDINLTNTHLILMAPVIDIRVQTAINLDGEKGVGHTEKKAPNSVTAGENGTNGKDGNAGFSSGSLNVFALDIVNPHNLTVTSKGGDGSDGQDGGDGKNGEVGERIVKEIVKYRDSWFLPWFEREVRDVSNRTVYYTKEKATDGGNGGNAGLGAAAGMVNFYLKNRKNVDCSIETSNGKSGEPGKDGKAGENPTIRVEAEPQSLYDVLTSKWDQLAITIGDDGDENTTETIYPVSDGADGTIHYKNSTVSINAMINEYIALAGKIEPAKAETVEFIAYMKKHYN